MVDYLAIADKALAEYRARQKQHPQSVPAVESPKPIPDNVIPFSENDRMAKRAGFMIVGSDEMYTATPVKRDYPAFRIEVIIESQDNGRWMAHADKIGGRGTTIKWLARDVTFNIALNEAAKYCAYFQRRNEPRKS